MATPSFQRTQVFISYSRNDIRWLKRLQAHLKPLQQKGLVERWDDTQIQAGDRWREQIEQALTRARIAVLLVSADFLASTFITKHELPTLLAAAEQGVRILPVIVDFCDFEGSPLSQFQSVNPPDKPLYKLEASAQDEVWMKVVMAIKKALEKPIIPEDRKRFFEKFWNISILITVILASVILLFLSWYNSIKEARYLSSDKKTFRRVRK